MSTSEPEAWSFSDNKFKAYDGSGTSSSEDSSDDEQIFSKMKTIKKKKFKKIVHKEELLPESLSWDIINVRRCQCPPDC